MPESPPSTSSDGCYLTGKTSRTQPRGESMPYALQLEQLCYLLTERQFFLQYLKTRNKEMK